MYAISLCSQWKSMWLYCISCRQRTLTTQQNTKPISRCSCWEIINRHSVQSHALSPPTDATAGHSCEHAHVECVCVCVWVLKVDSCKHPKARCFVFQLASSVFHTKAESISCSLVCTNIPCQSSQTIRVLIKSRVPVAWAVIPWALLTWERETGSCNRIHPWNGKHTVHSPYLHLISVQFREYRVWK